MGKTDIELVQLAKATRDDDAFAELVRRHQAKLRAFLLRLAGDAFAVDDIAQVTLIKAHRAIGEFRGGGSFRSWLFSIAYREFLQEKRRDATIARIKETAAEADVDSTSPSTDDMSLDLRNALARLPETERAALLLCDAAGFTHPEAAAALGAPLGSVKSWVLRGREKMRSMLSPPPKEAPIHPKARLKGTSYA